MSKLMFSEAELDLVSDPRFILTKNQIIDKVYMQFGHLSEQLFNQFGPLHKRFPEVFVNLPKISRGEKYHDLPWVMLDYPRNFKMDPGHFAIRVFFWWGNYYSVMAQFSGAYLLPIESALVTNKFDPMILGHPIWAGYPDDIWDCRVPQKGLAILSDQNGETMPDENRILKLAITVPLNNSHQLSELLEIFSAGIIRIFDQYKLASQPME